MIHRSWYFYPRSPCGERLYTDLNSAYGALISIHALLAESDRTTGRITKQHFISIHALLAESDDDGGMRDTKNLTFLSTLSLRRATNANLRRHRGNDDFYPRSPCGERRARRASRQQPAGISIHALLAESDGKPHKFAGQKLVFLSTLSLRRATPYVYILVNTFSFLSTLSLRRATRSQP